jgi:predicted secreted Zn-dependent protease
MSVKVRPTPIQRNSIDAAMELTYLYIDKFQNEPEKLEEIYSRFYALASKLERRHPDHLNSLIPEEILKKI